MSDPDLRSRGAALGEIDPAGAEYDQRAEKRRERERQRKRDARKRQTPAQRERERVRKRVARQHQTPEQRNREKEREKTRSRKKVRPFMGIDGEGGGTDNLGRQNYLLMVASGAEAGEERILQRRWKTPIG